MKTLEKQEKNYTTIEMVISHKFNGFPNIVCSGGKIYQLPIIIGKRSYPLKELEPKIHIGSIIYRINSRRVFASKLKKVSIKVNEYFMLEKLMDCPF